MLFNKTTTCIFISAWLLCSVATAQQDTPILNIKFNTLGLNTLEHKNSQDMGSPGFIPSAVSDATNFSKYDMTLTYPWVSQYINVDLGLTLRHRTESRNQLTQNTLPLLHASALYNFSANGLTAGIESNHAGSINNHLFDYKAKVSYEWRNGFGLQGGWQHQQFKQDNTAANLNDYELRGPYLDIYLNF